MSSAQTSSERKVSSFSNPTRQNRVNKRIKPLNREFFTQLIKLEADFHNKNYTVATLDELIQFYAKAVEYYDSVKDEISAYFIFKIQDILATKKSLKMLLDENTKVGVKRGAAPDGDITAGGPSKSKKRVTFGEVDPKQEKILEESSEEEDDEDQNLTEFEKRRRAKRVERTRERMSISRMKNQKQRFVNFFYKIENQKMSEIQNMHVVLDQFSTVSDKNDIFVNKDVNTQRDRLRKRLDKKKGESYLSHTMNAHSQFGNSADESQDRPEMMFESFLEDLHVQDKDLFKEAAIRNDDEASLSENADSEDFNPSGASHEKIDVDPQHEPLTEERIKPGESSDYATSSGMRNL